MAANKAESRAPSALEKVDDGTFHKRELVVQRIGRVLLVLFLLLGFLGVFGSGPVSQAQAGEGGTMQILYERFARLSAPTEMRLLLQPTMTSEGRVRLWLSAPFVESIKIEDIVPEPASMSSGQDRLLVDVDAEPGAAVEVLIRYQPGVVGPTSAIVGVVGKDELRVRQFVFP